MTDPLAVPPCPECAGEAIACDGCKQAYADAIEQLRAELATVASERDESWDALDRLGEAMKAAEEFRDMARRAGGPAYLYTLPWEATEQSND